MSREYVCGSVAVSIGEAMTAENGVDVFKRGPEPKVGSRRDGSAGVREQRRADSRLPCCTPPQLLCKSLCGFLSWTAKSQYHLQPCGIHHKVKP